MLRLRTVITINVAALLFSGWWLSAHVMRVGLAVDWEFWFSLVFFVVFALNVAFLSRNVRRAGP